MDKDSVKAHPEYGKPVHAFNIVKFQTIYMFVLVLFSIACLFGYYYQGAETFNSFETVFLFLFVAFIFYLVLYQWRQDREDVRFIIYENGFWSHNPILGSKENFVPFKDIESFDKGGYGNQVTIRCIVLNLKNKDAYNENISNFTKKMSSFQHWHLGTYQYIPVTLALNVGRDELLDILEYQFEEWQKRNGLHTDSEGFIYW